LIEDKLDIMVFLFETCGVNEKILSDDLCGLNNDRIASLPRLVQAYLDTRAIKGLRSREVDKSSLIFVSCKVVDGGTTFL
jgi:hypothetical protein